MEGDGEYQFFQSAVACFLLVLRYGEGISITLIVWIWLCRGPDPRACCLGSAALAEAAHGEVLSGAVGSAMYASVMAL